MPSVTRSGGRRLTYATYGDPDGDPLLFHHGTPGSRLCGALLDDAARAAGVRVVAPDRPGFGGSDPDPGRTLGDWADDCGALADALDLPAFAVAGFSGGGPFALAAGTDPRARAVGLVGTAAPGDGGGPLSALARVPPVLGLALRASAWVARRRSSEFVVGQFTDRDVPADVAATVERDFLAAFEGGPAGAVRETRLFADGWTAPAPARPVRAWHGRADDNAGLDAAQPLVEGLPTADLRVVEADHLGTLLDVREDLVALA
ncbi:MAG: alpha/beta fold hydrolase [Halobacteriaceae archaeon]